MGSLLKIFKTTPLSVISRLNLEEKYREKDWMITMALVIFAGSYICTGHLLSGKVASYVSSYVTAPAATICCLYLGQRVLTQFGGRKWYRATCYLGQKTLSIYLMHAYFIIATPALAKIWANMSLGSSITLQFFASLLASAMSIIICLLLEYILSQSRMLSFVFFGKGTLKM